MKKFDKILCPTDFSRFSEAGIENASILANATGATLLIVHVQSPSDADTRREQEHAQRLKAIVPKNPNLPYQHILATGDPITEIARLAMVHGVDLIVMGTHGRTGLMHALMGSVAESLFQRAPCPVFAYKEPSADGASA